MGKRVTIKGMMEYIGFGAENEGSG